MELLTELYSGFETVIQYGLYYFYELTNSIGIDPFSEDIVLEEISQRKVERRFGGSVDLSTTNTEVPISSVHLIIITSVIILLKKIWN